MIFSGNCTALVTPFLKNGKKIDFFALEKILEMQLKSKSGVLVLGTTGESPTLLKEEKIKLVKFVVEFVKNKIPVVVGAGSNDTKIAQENSRLFEDLGADALLHITPYYNKASQNGLIKHFEKVAKSTKVPIILYNVPSRTGVNILPQTVAKLAKIQNIVGIKEASGNLDQISEILRLTKNFCVFSGDDSLTLPALSVGASGVFSVLGNFVPQKIQDMCNAFFENNTKKAQQIHFELFPLAKAMFCDVNPMPVKSALKILGTCENTTRLPLTKINTKNFKLLKQLLLSNKLWKWVCFLF